jgi:hypothetical protein
MSKIRQTQLLLSAPRPPGFVGWDDTGARRARQGGAKHCGVGSGLLLHGLSPSLEVEARWRSWTEALTMYIYTWLRPLPLGETPVQTFLQWREDMIKTARAIRGNSPCVTPPQGPVLGVRTAKEGTSIAW